MYSEMKIQLFIDIVDILRRDYEFDNVKARGEDIGFGDNVLSIEESENIITFTIRKTKTHVSVVESVAWFELDGLLDKVIETLIHNLRDLLEANKVSILEGIEATVRAYYSISDKDIERTNGENVSFKVRDRLRMTYTFESNILCSEAYINSGTTIRLTNNIKDFTPTYLVQVIIPIMENLYTQFTDK